MAIYVRPDVWGSGVGKALLRTALLRLRIVGLVETVLWVIEENRDAFGFYEKLGFQPDGARRVQKMLGRSTRIIRLRAGLGGAVRE
jgi:GNAT superfamily N-acetyltransferase